MLKAAPSSETILHFHQTTLHHIPNDTTLHSQSQDKLKIIRVLFLEKGAIIMSLAIFLTFSMHSLHINTLLFVTFNTEATES
jgi:hypothetical protein